MELKEHETSLQIYSKTIDEDLEKSVKEHGILTPILITSDMSDIGANVIISGHSRLNAAKKTNMSNVPVIVSPLIDKMDIEEAIIISNKQRAKTNEQIGREFERLSGIEKERAKQRQQKSGADYGRGSKIKVVENFPQPIEKKARDKTGDKIGVSGRNGEKAAKVVKVIDELETSGEKEKAQEVRKNLNKSVNRGYNNAKPYIPQQKPLQQKRTKSVFNFTNDNIEWAKWTWNPVTGCKHGCKYCYARDIAMRYDGNFEPKFHPGRLSAPGNTKIGNKKDVLGIGSVFVCSMADLFGKWVSDEWIKQVFDMIQNNQQWKYLFLTKNPSRYLELTFPGNCWIGATADNQKRMDNATEAFGKLRKNRPLTFLSCEPLMEPIEMKSGENIDWLIIGGRSRTTKMQAAQPNWEWVESLLFTARENGIKVYFKPNLTVRPKEYPGK